MAVFYDYVGIKQQNGKRFKFKNCVEINYNS